VQRFVADAVVTMDPERRISRPGVLDVEGDRLRWVGPLDDAPPLPADGVESRVGGLLMPGLVNTHAHSAMTLFRSAGDGLPLDVWLERVIWPREGHMSSDDVRWGMRLGAYELLTAGVTTTCEMYLHDEAVIDAALEAGIRCVSTPGIFDLPGAGEDGRWESFLEHATEVHERFDGREGRVRVGLGPHSLYVLPTEAVEAVTAAASELGALVHLHLLETRRETELVRARHGCAAVELLERVGMLEQRCLVAHGVWLDDDDLRSLAAHAVGVAHCPGSNAKLGSGVARLSEMLDRGVAVGLGTDGPASSDDLDLWPQMRLAPALARAVAVDPGVVTTSQALELATRGGAAVLGLDAGVLQPGRLADFIRVELDDSRMVPGDDDDQLLAHLVWAGRGSLVTDVWVGGRAVVSGGSCRTIDGARARREVRRRARALAEAAGR
jgi:5-methylthioadenosine/S-adenosylhomocysteine deaminase